MSPMPWRDGDKTRYTKLERTLALIMIPPLVGLLFALDWLIGTNSVTEIVATLDFGFVICCVCIGVAGFHSQD